ncbi:MAG TPA: hypothetical protein EYP10_04765, partial [Armatimonadetes bacterium]|nr:hypothetical protein [Armatimonadota bacterium]
PPYYQGYWLERPVGRAYLERLGKLIPKDVIVIWTGPVTRSLEIKEDDLERYATVIGRVPMLWDNTVYAHRNRYGYDPRHPHYLFDTFATKYPSTFPERTLGITYNWNISNPIALVGGINTADYLWNPDAYDPQRSLRDALAIVAGSNCVDDLLAFREAYYEIFDAVTANRIVENTSKLMAAERTLTQVYQRLSAKCDNREFVSALEGRLRYAQKLLTPVKTSLELIHHAHKSQLVDLNFKHGDWRRSSEGKWSCSVLDNAVEFSFPSRTRSFAGAYAQLSRHITVPKSPTGKYYLAFGVTDNYRNAGTPPRAWPGYMFKQVLVNGEVVWEDDVEGDEPIEQRVLQIIEVTDALKDEREAVIAFRAMDKRGVSNMSVRIQFSAPLITAGPFELLYRTVEIPGAPVLNVRKEISVLLRIRPTAIGRRQGLYIKMPPIQYFGYLHERGTVTLGIFINGKEYRVNSKTQLQAGRTYHIAFTYDGRRMRIFVNGRLEGERRTTGAIDDGHGNLFIGSYRNMAQPFEGEIEELKLFARCLSSNEIQTDATAQFALEVKAQSLPMGLIGWWRPAREKLIARDYSGNANDGSIYWRWGIQ